MKTMYHIAFLAFAIFTSLSLYGRDYYFSAAGNDDNPGTESAPFKTLSKASSTRFAPGDRLLFRRGDVFRGELRMFSSGTASAPIVIESYGNGDDAVISGSEIVNNWVPAGNGIYKAGCETYPEMIFYKGVAQQLARFPKQGFLFTDDGNGARGFTDNDLPDKGSLYIGAGVHIRTSRFKYEERKISAQSGGYLGFDRSVSTAVVKGAGYYLSNKLEFVDLPGEYYYDAKNKQLFFKTPDGKMPADHSIEVSKQQYGIRAESAAHLIVRNLTIRHQETAGVYIHGNKTDNLHIDECLFENIYLYGIMGANKNALTVSRNVFKDIWDGAIFIGGMTNVDINHNTFHRIGIQAPGRATDDLISYRCIDMNHSSGSITDNVIDSVGFTGITFFQNTNVERNRISRFCMSIDDGSGIGAHGVSGGIRNGTHSFVRNNIISDAAGTAESFPMRTDPFVNGIFMDDNSGNAVIENNTIYNIEGKGIFIHNSSFNQIHDNTIFNCSGGSLVMEHDYSGDIPEGNVASGNILYNIEKGQHNLRIANWHPSERGLNFGTFTGNYYINPYNEAVIYTAGYGTNLQGHSDLVQNEYTVRGWREMADRSAKSAPVRLFTYKVVSTAGSNLVTNGNFDLGADGWGCYADNNSCSVEWKSSGELDGGHLRISSPWFPYGNFFNTRHVALDKNKQYLLRFSVAGKHNALLAFNIVDRNAGYAELSTKSYHEVASQRIEHERLITPKNSSSAGQLTFFLGPELVPEFSIDNIQLQEVTTTAVNPLTQNLFYLNNSAVEQTIVLPDRCLDVDSNLVSGKITLAPFSSRIFIINNQSVLPLSVTEINAQRLTEESALIQWQINGTNGQCDIFLEKSADGQTFETIARFNWTEQTKEYQFTDYNSPEAAFYRIKTQCSGEAPAYSKIVKIEKAGNRIHRSFVHPNPITGSTITVNNYDQFSIAEMFSVDGKMIFRFQLHEGTNRVDLPSGTVRGVYLLKLRGANHSKTFKVLKE